ncbi:Helix-hairpin-helix motif-containing protein [Robiginitalea myxolifaciens]|uniref:Helix-hairpin-helix motif-containing protein n=2 Tax=Robiginitalea myxolifaciens TaxID=400055 RepID=A0A1I6FP21_9FLAO|nr:Helix-hairpin-helix motif-containing protein [Robiginitalea myxolifaciens]
MYIFLLLSLGLRLWLPGLLRPDPEMLLEEDSAFISWLHQQDSLQRLQESEAQLPGKSGQPTLTHKAPNKPQRSKQDLNTASATELQAVRGIGPILSKRILKFRDALGGFLHESQLRDVYGLSPEVAREAMKRFTIVDAPDIAPLDINTASKEELSGLIYLDWNMVNEIVRYRNAHGNISKPSELAQLLGIPQDKIDRIALYLQF